MKGRFIVLDGPDGCGKSTQAAMLVRWLRRKKNIKVLHLREPGGTPIGEKIRDLLLDRRHGEMCVKTELFLYQASRAQLVEEVIRPALAKGVVVVCERFLSSSVVYQGIAGKLGRKPVRDTGAIAVGGTMPDMTIVLDVPARKGLSRIKKGFDRIESKKLAFHDRVRRGFLSLAKDSPRTVRVIVADGPVDEVHAEVVKVVNRLPGF
jgi:dTMP kinase